MDSDVPKTKKLSSFYKSLIILLFLAVNLLAMSVKHYAVPANSKVDAMISVVNSKRNDPPANIAVWLEPVGKAAPLPKQIMPLPEIKQKGKKFVPHVLVIPINQDVSFPNEDPFPHNVFSASDIKRFDLGLYQAGDKRQLNINRAGVIPVYCNIHPQMKAYILSLKTPYFGLSNDKGEVKIDNVPPGKYTVKVWHEKALDEVLDKLSRPVTVTGGTFSLGNIQVDETGYTATPHKNKDNKDYASNF